MTFVLHLAGVLMAAASGVGLVAVLAVFAWLLRWAWRVWSWLDGK